MNIDKNLLTSVLVKSPDNSKIRGNHCIVPINTHRSKSYIYYTYLRFELKKYSFIDKNNRYISLIWGDPSLKISKTKITKSKI